jgi:hypothetical protein
MRTYDKLIATISARRSLRLAQLGFGEGSGANQH